MINISVSIAINGDIQQVDETTMQNFIIKETDYVSVQIKGMEDFPPPIVRFEDYEINASLSLGDDGTRTYSIPSNTYLSECFGKVILRIEIENLVIPVVFDVLAKKTSAEQAEKMIKYLAEFSPSLVKACLSRSALPVGNISAEQIEPESLISTAENLISFLESVQQELINNIKERLVLKRLPLSASNRLTCEVDPIDVLSNLDALTPAIGTGDVSLRGRNFDLGDIDVSAVQSTADVYENKIILGALYSMRRRIALLQSTLQGYPLTADGSPAGFESFTRLLLSLTADGMLRRCQKCLDAIDRFLDLFENRLSIKFEGELVPVMTPFVRSNRIYRSLYSQISDWYALGTPDLGTIRFLMKMKSLSKIYELFTFYHIFEELSRTGWNLVSSIPHPEFGEYMPRSAQFTKEQEGLNIEYEPTITKFGPNTRSGDLVDVAHSPNANHPYWTPDFVLKWLCNDELRYFILDAKYSTASSVRQYALPSIYSKYYEGTAVYDKQSHSTSSLPIKAVIAVYALEWNNPSFISKWEYQGLNSALPRIPVIGGIGLMTENDTFFNKSLGRIFELARTSPGFQQKTPAPESIRSIAAQAF